MRQVDTSAWIEYLTGSEIGRRVGAELSDRREWLVPTMVQLELVKWLTREMGEATSDRLLAFMETCVVAELDTSIAVSAAALCRQHRLATADAVIYATSLAYGAELLTCDSHFDGLAGVMLLAKRH